MKAARFYSGSFRLLSMFFARRPPDSAIRQFLRQQQSAAFSYPDVGASLRNAAPRCFQLDHVRSQIGAGTGNWRAAQRAILSWKMFDMNWIHVCLSASTLRPGIVAAVLIRHYGFWSLNACRVIDLIDEQRDGIDRFGFAYGTLKEHGEEGEERFTVEWHRGDDSVWYDLYAFSRPHARLARLGYPWTRKLQARFRRDSVRAMARATAEMNCR